MSMEDRISLTIEDGIAHARLGVQVDNSSHASQCRVAYLNF